MKNASDKIGYYRELLSKNQAAFLKAKNQNDKAILKRQIETFRKLHLRFSTLAGIEAQSNQLQLFKTSLIMENTDTNTSNLESVYDFLKRQTYDERKEFIKALKEHGVSSQQVRNWIGKRSSIPWKHHKLINAIAGKDLNYPKLKIVSVVES